MTMQEEAPNCARCPYKVSDRICRTKEADVVSTVFSAAGFDVISVVCKVGRTSKEQIGVAKEQQIDPKAEEAMCNPVSQAMVLNKAKTHFNVLLGF